MVTVGAAVPPPPAAAAASDKSPRGDSVLDKFPCNEFAPDEK